MCLRSWSTRNQACPHGLPVDLGFGVDLFRAGHRGALHPREVLRQVGDVGQVAEQHLLADDDLGRALKSPMRGRCPCGRRRRAPIGPASLRWSAHEPERSGRRPRAEVGQRRAAVAGTPAGDGGAHRGHRRRCRPAPGRCRSAGRGRSGGRRPRSSARSMGVEGGEVPRRQRGDLAHEPEPEQPLVPPVGELLEALEQHGLETSSGCSSRRCAPRAAARSRSTRSGSGLTMTSSLLPK